MLFSIKYGILNNHIDVTEICLTKMCKKNIIFIPSGDDIRSIFFTDPLPNILKYIFVYDNLNLIGTYNDEVDIFIDMKNNQIYTEKIPDHIKKNFIETEYNEYAYKRLKEIHNNLKIEHGSFNDEYIEQMMVARYLTGNEKILEIGGNIGRNSLVIAYILNHNNNNNLVTLESDQDIAKQLISNKKLNNLDFYIEASALSKRNLIQKDWTTMESDTIPYSYKKVNIISWEELNNKYKIDFDTLILDCEGAFYFILMDFPEILNNIKLIIMENDYPELEKKQYVDKILLENNFKIIYTKNGGWGPCRNNFYEIWIKTFNNFIS